jgi:NADPH-dependent glutamate synthase beta subunit-like oxidoreductase/2,4-dienoyl-CoA reductase-like NADH-dependent reductase (Old Yellow Enzyme family)
MEFTELFKPIKLGTLEIKNRIGGACTTTGGADINGYITENGVATYAARAAGGAGFVCIECTFASDFAAATSSFGNPRISNRSYWAGLSELAETINAFGAKAFIQISPGFGRQGSSKVSGKTPPAPSPIPCEVCHDFDMRVMPYGWESRAAQQRGHAREPREMTLEEIEWMENQYPDAVAAAMICGYDAVELHSPHGYLIHQFLSPRSNQRTDKYGGSLENRMRFLRNLFINSRKRVGPDYPIGIRLSGDEQMENGLHPEEVAIIAKEMENEGIDWLHVSSGSYEAREYFFPQHPDTMIQHAQDFKSVVKVPVLVPSVHDPYLAERIVKEGKTDMVTLGRQLIADPHWPRKVQEGKIDEISMCVKCNVCLGRFNRGLQIRCPLNPNSGRERYMPEYHRPPVPAKQPPCEEACPAHIDIQNYALMISRGRFDEALTKIRKTTPLYGVVGRVCHQPCETTCNRGQLDQPIAINDLKRFVADYEMSNGGRVVEPAVRTKKETVAVIGSGPGGLTAAYDLVTMGYGVTIFEALPVAGGCMAVGIPEYRLPKNILQAELDVIQNTGVEIRLNSPVGGSDGLTIDDLWEQGYKAIFIAVGAHKTEKLGVPNENVEGVVDGASWLKDLNLGKDVSVGKKVVVVGGGNVAIDSARTALRLGVEEVSVVYRRTGEEMPAIKMEIEEAQKEGITIHFLASPYKIMCENNVCSGIECFEMELGDEDTSGRKTPMYVAGSEFKIEADMVISAVGQAPDLSFLPEDSKLQLWLGGRVVVDDNMATNIPGIFAGGDAVTGPASVIDAIAAGKKAAIAIDCYLTGKPYPADETVLQLADMDDRAMKFHLREVEKEERAVMPLLNMQERCTSFKEVHHGLGKEEAIREARRCLTCRVSSMRY